MILKSKIICSFIGYDLMYAPHHIMSHFEKYSTALTEITEHGRAYFRLFRT